MATLLIRHPDGTEHEHELAGQLTVGRADGNDLVLGEGGVSRKHARFFTEEGAVLVEDSGSANGTFVDGERIAGPTKLGPRAQVVIGEYEIKLKGNGAASSKAKAAGPKPTGKPSEHKTGVLKSVKGGAGAPPRSTRVIPAVKSDPAAGSSMVKRPRPGGGAAPGGGSGPTLRGLTGALMNKSFPLKGTMVVGRVAGVEIQIEDDSVSRRHAELVVSGKDVVLRDLGSANGTTVNGQPLTEEATLQPGDILQFGVVEMSFDVGGSASRGAARPGGRAGSRRGREGDEALPAMAEDGEGALDPKKKKMLIAGGVGLAMVLGIMLVLVFREPERPIDAPIGGGKKAPIAPVDPCTLKEEYLSQARQFSSVDLGEPNWEKAENACKKVLDCDPIDAEANQLMRKVKMERSAEEAHNAGKKLVTRNREEEALDQFKRIPSDSTYYLKTIPLVKDALDAVKKKAGQECKEYSNANRWPEALPRCQRYIEIACQTMSLEELYPSALQKVNLSGAMRKGDWRPKDPQYLNFLKAREKVDPGARPWECIKLDILKTEERKGQTLESWQKEFAKRYKEKEIADAVGLYFLGKGPEAFVVLQKVAENISKATMHAQAREMAKDISNVEQLYKEGSGELGNNRPDKADPSFGEALQIDERLILGGPADTPEKKKELDKYTSYYRRNIQQEMASSSYARGKDLADRGDRKQACKVWKLGFSYWKGNTDLLRALTNVCTQEASRRIEAAESCDDLNLVLDFAVDGDGNKEQVEKKKADQGCL